MYILKAFVEIQTLVSNVPNVISEIGELSTFSETYIKSYVEYQADDIPSYRLYGKYYDTTTGGLDLNPNLAHEAIEVVRSVLAYAGGHIRPYDLTDYIQTIAVAYYNRIYNLQFGPFKDNGNIALPEWISWTSQDQQQAYVKVWLSDTAFQNQYDEYDIVVVPPLPILSDFFLPIGSLITKLQDETIEKIMLRVQTAKEQNPESYIRSYQFNYVPAIVGQSPIPTTWTVLIYGSAGDNIDSIKDAIIAYLLANSTHTRAEWSAILPDIFKRTEFILLPRWDRYAIPNQTLVSGIYGSWVDPVETLSYAVAHVPYYPEAHVRSSVSVMPFPQYKGISIVAVDGPMNIAGRTRITEVFPDYVPVPTTSLDFNRMRLQTQSWLLLLEDMLIAAETLDVFSSVPLTMRKVYRDQVLYLSAMHDNINYLMLPLSSTIV